MSYSEKQTLYPEIPSAPQEDEGQNYRLAKIDQMEKFLREEVAYRDSVNKRCKRRSTAMTISDTSVISTITCLELASIATLSTGVGIPISIVLAGTGLLLSLGSVVIHKTQKILESKAKKHERIRTLAESKLDSISGLVSKAIEDANISHHEYQIILREVESYRLLKQQIRTKSKRVVDSITSEQRESILQQGREQGKQDFLAKIAGTSNIPHANAT